MSRAETLKLLGETDMEGYATIVALAKSMQSDLGPRLLWTERAIRAAAAEHDISLTLYPNADLAERILG